MQVFAAFMVCTLLSSLGPLYAQTYSDDRIRIIIAPVSGIVEPDLEAVLLGTVRLAIAQQGFTLSGMDGDVQGQPSGDFEFDVRYALSGNHVSLSFSLWDTRQPAPLATNSYELVLDPQFDQSVSAIVLSIVPSAETVMATRTAAAIPPALSAGAAAPPVRRAVRDVKAGLGAFLPMGRAGSYFDFAFRFGAAIGFSLGDDDRWSADLGAMAITFTVDGASSIQARMVFGLLGGGLEYRLVSAGAFFVSCAASAGASLTSMYGTGIDQYIGIMPFGSAELSAGLYLSSVMAIQFVGSSLAMVDFGGDSTAAIWGLSPSLALRMEL
ncbi:MAG: hypothetical protein E4H20_05995 [Spirochaetales bacterium]|nr:MAG: hypothetical protein E4H20_05995 [Spirochaetales bacterium]